MKNYPCAYVASNGCEPPKIGINTQFDNGTITALRVRLPEYLAARGVELRRNGSRLVGKCPIHDDRTPSFAVFGTHHETCGCYPCGFTGDVFEVSKWLGRSSTFPEAVADVAATLGVYLPNSTAGTATRPATATPRPAKQPEPPFVLSNAERKTVHAARLAFSDAFWSGDEIVDRIAASLGLDRETLRLASWGSSGLGLANGWLCYAYPNGLKWRNPDPKSKPRFVWLVGKATAPWRAEWIKPETQTVYCTEGESDCMALIAAGLEADGSAVCVASPGTSFPRDWAPLFRGKRSVLCFDTDPPGRAATASVAAILKGHASEILTWKGTTSHV
ncbi:MAG: CHC2 zinc finger domain-containing protein [Akkermansiaceae bacterium]